MVWLDVLVKGGDHRWAAFLRGRWWRARPTDEYLP
jgi:hypothetical protein